MENLLDIEYLRNTGCRPKWFGLGFIQLKLSDERRMHFWHPDLLPDDPAFIEEYHDHRYDFHSRILKGSITNHIATIEPDMSGEYSLFEVCCSGGGQEYRNRVTVLDGGSFTNTAGSSYRLHRDTFHRVTAERCVTIQTRANECKTKALVVQHADRPSMNPFSRHIDDNILWGYIGDLLNEDVDTPGYHLRKIEKGVLGEVSKIREELEELEDAFAQDSRVMELVELSDMIGSIRAFLEKRHPTFTIHDLMTFDAITERAFRNGRR